MNGDHRLRLRKLTVVGLYLLAAAWGVSIALRPESGVLRLVFSVAVASTMTLWCVQDSRILGRPLLKSLHFIVFLIWPIAVPVYLVWSRKVRGLMLGLVHAVGLCLVYAATFIPLAIAPPWLAHQGHLALLNHDYGRAVTMLGRAVRLKDDQPDWWRNLGIALQEDGRIDQAAEAYERVLELVGRDAECREALFGCQWHLAYAAQTRADYEEAKTRYRKAIALAPSQPALWYALGTACDASGDVQGGIEALEKACSLAPAEEAYRKHLETLRGKIERGPRPK